jgi:hypothetical protein
MGWSRLQVRRRAVLALSLLLAGSAVLGSGARVAAQPAADAQARPALELVSNAIGQPGKVFRTQLNIRERTQPGEVASTASVWIDAEQKKARFELRRDNSLIGVTAVDNWDVAAYDALNNKVTTISVPDETRGQVRNPAYSVLAPSLIAAYQAGQINPDADVTTSTDQVNGRQATKLSLTLNIQQQVPAPPDQGQQGGNQQGGNQQNQGPPPTQTINVSQEYGLWMDPTAGTPIQETVRTADDKGNELSFRTVSYDNPTLVDRSTVPSDTLSIQAVQNMLASVDQQIDRVRQIGFPTWWLGREFGRAFTDMKGQRQQGLVLNDVRVLNQPGTPRLVVLQYGTRDDPQVPYVVLTAQSRSDWDQLQQQAQGQLWFQQSQVQRSSVQVPGGAQGTLYQLQPPPVPAGGPGASAGPGGRPGQGGQGGSGGAANQPPVQLPPLVMVQVAGGDGVLIVDTPALFTQDGRQANPFMDPTQIAALAGALAPLQ